MLGGDTILFPPEALDKKEDIKDVIGYLENWADMVIVRYKDLSLIEYMAEHSYIPIINAMTAVNHPCEILTDLYPFSKKHVDYSEKECLFMGSKGNIGNTWKEASELVGFNFTQCCPRGYKIDRAIIKVSTSCRRVQRWNKRCYRTKSMDCIRKARTCSSNGTV